MYVCCCRYEDPRQAQQLLDGFCFHKTCTMSEYMHEKMFGNHYKINPLFD